MEPSNISLDPLKVIESLKRQVANQAGVIAQLEAFIDAINSQQATEGNDGGAVHLPE